MLIRLSVQGWTRLLTGALELDSLQSIQEKAGTQLAVSLLFMPLAADAVYQYRAQVPSL